MRRDFFDVSEWYQMWGGHCSLLLCSLFSLQYTRTLWVGNITFMDKTVFSYANMSVACSAPAASRHRFGKYLAAWVEESPRRAKVWPEMLCGEADRLRHFMKKNHARDLSWEECLDFLDRVSDYYVPHIFVKYTVDYLSPKSLKQYLPHFEHARLYAETAFDELVDFFNTLIEIHAKNDGGDPTLALCLVHSEFATWYQTGRLPAKKILLDRQRGCVLLCDRTNDEVRTGVAAKKVVALLHRQENSDVLRGMIAYPGKVRGIVRIVTNPKKVKTFNRGDILVTTMTRPDYLPLMKKAAAFVTDSGGVLSHAAIVARELKKPCVIATQHATHVLRDGQVVEVDAGKGKVRVVG